MILREPVTSDEPCRFNVGGLYSVPLRGFQKRQRIRVESVVRGSLGAVPHKDAIQMGWHGKHARARWMADWVEEWDAAWVRRAECSSGVPRRPLSDVDLCRRFGCLWAGFDCWVISFSLVEPEEFLANQQGVKACSRDGQYVTTASKAMDPLPVMHPSKADVLAARADGEARRASLKAEIDAARAEAKANSRSAQKRRERGQLYSQRNPV